MILNQDANTKDVDEQFSPRMLVSLRLSFGDLLENSTVLGPKRQLEGL
jgi:hypothetical protein